MPAMHNGAANWVRALAADNRAGTRLHRHAGDDADCLEAIAIMLEKADSGASRALRVFEALATINRLHDISDAVYNVRERFGGEPVDGVPFTGNSWEHPTVLAYGKAVMLLKNEGVL